MRRLLATAAGLTLLLAACGGDDDSSDSAVSAPAESTATESSPETEPVATAAAATTPATDPTETAPATAATDPETSATSADGWTYTDGSGRTIELEERPERIVAHASSAAALMAFGIRPVGIYADTAVEDDLALQDLDLSGIEIIGEEWGVINLEALAALRPDLIVAEYWPIEGGYSGMEPGTEAADQPLLQIADVAGPAQGPSILQMIEDYAALAELLGADLDDPAIAESKAEFEDALARFQEAVAAKPDLSVLAVSPTVDVLYVAVPEHAAELADLASWGLGLVVPENPDEGFEYWESFSWEEANRYPADLLIVDERDFDGAMATVAEQPGWQLMPAAAADAVGIWPAYWLRRYDDYAMALDRLSAEVEQADENLVSG